MSIVRQESLFSIRILLDLEPTQRYDEIFEAIDIHPVINVVAKKSSLGLPVELNYSVMIQSLIVRIVERIPEIQLLVKRLNTDLRFKCDCEFLVSDPIPSEASFSKMITKIKESDVLKRIDSQVLNDAMMEGFIVEGNVAFDAGHFESRDRAPSNKKEPEQPKTPKKRGRKPIAERESMATGKRSTGGFVADLREKNSRSTICFIRRASC